jgi:diphthamide biosynthesis protein 2
MDSSKTWDIDGTASWIRSVVRRRGADAAEEPSTTPHAETSPHPSRVCLQLPDDLLANAAELSASLQTALDGMDVDIYILADTTYNALSVDEVASAHVDADCIVHYGRASLSKTTGRVPVYYVFPRVDGYRYEPEGGSARINLAEEAAEEAEAGSTGSTVTCFVDQVFRHAFEEVCSYIRDELLEGYDVRFPPLIGAEGEPSVGGYARAVDLDDGDGDGDGGGSIDHEHFVWYGAGDAPARELLLLTYNARTWTSIDPINGTIERGLPLKVQQTLRKRYFLVDKARQANIVGLVGI